MIKKEDYSDCLKHIDKYWSKVIYRTSKDSGLLIGVPNRYVAPSNGEFKKKMYYWDSYFIILGLLSSGKTALSKGIVDNLLHLFQRFKFIPASNRFYHLAKSNPPFLSSMVLEVFQGTQDVKWLKAAAKANQGEYEEVWTSDKRQAKNGLSHYWDPTYYHDQAEDESGWDTTSRFLKRGLDINPIDLNSLLYKYETDLAYIHGILKNKKKSEQWLGKASLRKRRINQYMWDKKQGFFFDYDFVSKKKTPVWSLAGYFPLWAGLASRKQAGLLRERLVRFEKAGGLVTTDKKYLKDGQHQWDYPNGWANLHWIVIKGLLNYGFHDDAERLAKKWLDTCKIVFNKTGKFWEKYDVVKQEVGRSERYPPQHGFGWTNGVFIKLIDEFSANI